jgi:hypothetical protein
MNSKRLEDLHAIKWHLITGNSDLDTIIKETAAMNNGKVPRELAIAFLHLKESAKALSLFLKTATSDDAGVVATKETFNNELNSGTDS